MRKIACLLMAVSLLWCVSCASVQSSASSVEERSSAIESLLDLSQNRDQEWSYSADSSSWTLSVVSAVAYPVIAEEEGVSVCVPAAYVVGIDTDGDGKADVVASGADLTVKGSLVIDYDATVTSSHGVEYTASTAPVILNTGAAGYGSAKNTLAQSTYAKEGYINVSCGNRGKQDTVVASDGSVTYTGDAPSCLVDQKAAARFVRYNILLGNLPGSLEYWVSTGGSGGGAHATMFASTSDSPDFLPYQEELGAVGVYKDASGNYTTSVTIEGRPYELSDGAWGAIAYSPITSLYEADMAMAFEYLLDPSYSFSSSFQKQMAQYLAQEYQQYINGENLSVKESSVGFDLNGDGDLDDLIPLTITYDEATGKYQGSYLDLYLATFKQNLQWYLEHLDYAEGWTWFSCDGAKLTDEEVASLTTEEKAQAFIEGRYVRPETKKGFGMMMGNLNVARGGDQMFVGTPGEGSTQASGSSSDSSTYASYDAMLSAYRADIEEVYAGDTYGNNQVALYNPLTYIADDSVGKPVWIRMVCGAAEGDISMLNSLHLQLAFLAQGVDTTIEWQWDGSHVPSEIFGNSFSQYVDQMYAKHVSGGDVTVSSALVVVSNGEASSPTGTDLSTWVSADGTFSLEAIAHYRTEHASKAVPGFDVIDYGQEDYVFGSSSRDARHWDTFVLKVLEEHREQLEPLFHASTEL